MATKGIREIAITNDSNYLIEPTLYTKVNQTSAATTFTADLDKFELFDGVTVAVKFGVTNNASATLNINSTGAKAIYYESAAITASKLKAKHTYVFTYNGTQWELIGDLDTDTNTHRPINVNGTQTLGNNNTALNLKNGTNVTITSNSGDVTIAATDTTYTFANGTNGFTVTPSGGTAQTVTVTPSITNNITGSGTENYLTKFTGTNTIGNSGLTTDSNNNLTIPGSIYFSSNTSTETGKPLFAYNSTYPKYGIWYKEGTPDVMAFSASGNGDLTISADFAVEGGGKLYNKGNIIPHTGNNTGSVGGTTTPVYIDGGQVKALSYTIAKSVPSNAVFTDTNKYHKSGSWGGTNSLTYTATAVNSADELAFTLATASTSVYGATKLYNGVDSTSTTLAATANAVKTAYDRANAIVAAADAMVFKGTLNGATSTTYTPAADRGHTYKVAIAGLINGEPVEVGDMLICTTDSTAEATSSNVSTIKANWVIIQTNIDGAVTGPAAVSSGRDNSIARFNGETGKIIQDSLVTIDDNGHMSFGAEKVINFRMNRKKADGGGWACSYINWYDNANTLFANMGAYGTNDNLSYLYLGAEAYNSTKNLRILPSGRIRVLSLDFNGTDSYGSETQPIYWKDGVPVACTSYANASVNYASSAGTATTLQNARTLWGQSFNGSANVTGSMTDVGPQFRLPTGQTNFAFLTSTGGAATSQFGRLGLADSYSTIDLNNYRLDVNGNGRFRDVLTIYKEGTTSQNLPAKITFTTKDTDKNTTNTGYIAYYHDHATTYNGNLVISSGGGTFVGGGESAASIYSALGSTTSTENLYLSADGSTYIYSNADTAANRIGLAINTSGHIIPVKAEAVNNNAQDLGSSSAKWANIYGTTFDGTILKLHQGTAADPSLSGNARIEFDYTSGQPVVISYTPNDSYRAPAGLKIMGGSGATPAWLEVEGDVYAAAFKGNAITAGTRWDAITQGQKWSRICLITPTHTTEGTSGILSISCTRADVVVNATFLITLSHAGTKRCIISQIGSNNYSYVKIRGVVRSNGTGYIELYDFTNSITSGTTQTWHCTYLPLLNSTVTAYTTFTTGETIPSGYAAENELQTLVGDSTYGIVNITRSGTTFTATRSNGSTFTFTQQDSDTKSFTITANATDGYWDLTGTNGTNAVTYALAPYSSKQSGANFYTGTTNPDGTTRLNYNGYLYATKLYSGGTEVSVSGHTHSYLPLDTVVTNVSYTSASDNNAYPILMKNSTGTTTTAGGVKFNSNVTINPSTGAVTAPSFYGSLGYNYKTITVDGDAATYYPVVITSASGKYPATLVSITRQYNEKGPDTWNTSTHRGGLTCTFLWNNSRYWDGNGAGGGDSIELIRLQQTYCNMVGKISTSTSGLVVWLRGGGADYHIFTEHGTAVSANVQLNGFTDSANQTFNAITTIDTANIESYRRLNVTAATAVNLSAKPVLAASGNNITVTAGGKTSDAFTVPYATSAGSASTISAAGGSAAKFWRGDNTWSDTISGGLLKITNNSITLTIGARNGNWVHFENDSTKPYYFDNSLNVSGNFKVYNTNTYLADNNLTFSQGGGWAMSDATWIRTVGAKSIYQNAGTLRTDGTFQVGADGKYVQFNSTGIKLGDSSASTNNNANLITINGHMVINGSYNTLNSYSEGIRINRSANGRSIITLGGSQDTTSGTGKGVWAIGSLATPNDATTSVENITNSIFYISYNGSDGATNRLTGHNATGFSIRPRLGIGTDPDATYALKVAGTSWVQGPLRIGNADTAGTGTGQNGYANANSGSTNYIAFYGVYGDNPGSFNHTYIGESIYGSKTTANEQSELLLFKGNDIAASSDPDRIRLFASQVDIQVYETALSGTWDVIRATTGTQVANFAKGKVTINGETISTSFTGPLNGNATSASKITDITTTDVASDTATWRRVWFSYNDNVTGRPAYKDTIAFQTSTNTLKSGKYLVGDHVTLEYNTTDDSLDFVFI